MAFEVAVNSDLSGVGATTTLPHSLPSATPAAAIIFATTNSAFGVASGNDAEISVGITDFTTSMTGMFSEQNGQLLVAQSNGTSLTLSRLYDRSALALWFSGTPSVSGSDIVYTWATSPTASAPLMQFVFGGCSAKVLSFTADSTKILNDTQNITGIGFEPKFLFFIGSPRYSTTAGVTNFNVARWTFGFASIPRTIANRAVSLFSAASAATDTDCGRQYSNSACIAFPNSGNSAIDGSFKVSAVVSGDGFTIQYIDPFSADVTIQVLALGGADFDCEALDWAAPSSDGDQTATFTNIDPIGALLLSTGSAGGYDTYQTDRYRLGCGFVSETGPKEGGFSISQADALGTTATGMSAWQAKTASLGQTGAAAANTLKLKTTSPFSGSAIAFTYEGMTFAPIVMACGFAPAVVSSYVPRLSLLGVG